MKKQQSTYDRISEAIQYLEDVRCSIQKYESEPKIEIVLDKVKEKLISEQTEK